jgi:hypothetical protein
MEFNERLRRTCVYFPKDEYIRDIYIFVCFICANVSKVQAEEELNSLVPYAINLYLCHARRYSRDEVTSRIGVDQSVSATCLPDPSPRT